MISANSRYVSSKIITSTKNDGTNVLSITPSDAVAFTFTYSFHVTNGAERVDNISYAYYGDPTKWWRIADANPEIMKWDSIPPGTVLRIPNA